MGVATLRIVAFLRATAAPPMNLPSLLFKVVEDMAFVATVIVLLRRRRRRLRLSIRQTVKVKLGGFERMECAKKKESEAD